MSVVNEETRTAAKRAFVRTAAQALSATLTTGVSASVILAIVSGEVELVPTLVTIGVALASPFVAGAAAYFSIIGGGVPAAYVDAAHSEDPGHEAHPIVPEDDTDTVFDLSEGRYAADQT